MVKQIVEEVLLRPHTFRKGRKLKRCPNGLETRVRTLAAFIFSGEFLERKLAHVRIPNAVWVFRDGPVAQTSALQGLTRQD